MTETRSGFVGPAWLSLDELSQPHETEGTAQGGCVGAFWAGDHRHRWTERSQSI